jgi:hypothetical protein
MPADRSAGARYAAIIVELYAGVEAELARLVARQLERGLAHDKLDVKLAAAAEVRRAAESAMAKLGGKLGPAVERALHRAAAAGANDALEELLKLRDRRAAGRRLSTIGAGTPNAASILRVASSLAAGLDSRLRATHLQVVRSTEDIYRQAVAAQSAAGVLAGAVTRREATQRALDHLWKQGITGFVDKRGRRWNLAGYVEMATLTTTSQAAVQSHLDQLGQQGVDLVMVSDSPAECPLCRPWEGKILTTGSSGLGGITTVRPSVMDDSTVTVDVAGSVPQAIAAGLMHPRCTHRFVAYLPGATRVQPAQSNPDGYDAQQRQRLLEREARRLDVERAGAVDPARRRQLDAAYQAKRAEIAAHVKATPGARRKTERERINLGHKPGTPAPKPTKAAQPLKPAAKPKAAKPTPAVKVEPSAHPLLDGRPKIDERSAGQRLEAAGRDAKATNPKFPQSGYATNCVHVVNAFELRARGYSVAASPISGSLLQNGRSSQEALERWVDKDGKPHGRKFTGITAGEMIQMASALPEGGRGWIRVYWEKGGGHIFNVERINGYLRFIEAQEGTFGFNINDYIALAQPNKSWGFVRVDDLEPTDKVMEFIV